MRALCLGFTIVETIAAVFAIGLVAAVALPHFGSQQRDLRIAKLQQARGAVQSAAALLHGVAQARLNQPQGPCIAVGFGANPPLVNTAGNGNLCTETGRVQVMRLFPAPTLAGIVASAGLVPVAGTPTPAQLAHDGLQGVSEPDALQIRIAGAPDAASCAFTYRAPASLGMPPVITGLVTSGC